MTMIDPTPKTAKAAMSPAKALRFMPLLLAIGLGVVALGRGIVEHGFMMPSAVGGLGLGVMAGALTLPHGPGEVVYTILGVAILALGHDLNRRAVI